MTPRIGIDLGGTKIEGVVMSADSQIIARQRIATPHNSYEATLDAIVGLKQRLESAVSAKNLPLGICTPGAVSQPSGLMKNSNSTCLNGQPLLRDLEAALGRCVRIANDADCLALSEARDGAGAGANTVFAAILGTGVGGGIVVRGQLLQGPNAIAGEWGHTALPWISADELPGPPCYCGRCGCIETWVSGPGLSADYKRATGFVRDAEEIAAAAARADTQAEAAMQRYEHRLARSLAGIINVLDPDVIVLGGGVSQVRRWYRTVPVLWGQWVFSDSVLTRLAQAQYGDASGVRGAAWLWS